MTPERRKNANARVKEANNMTSTEFLNDPQAQATVKELLIEFNCCGNNLFNNSFTFIQWLSAELNEQLTPECEVAVLEYAHSHTAQCHYLEGCMTRLQFKCMPKNAQNSFLKWLETRIDYLPEFKRISAYYQSA